jgi:hypothetical protein
MAPVSPTGFPRNRAQLRRIIAAIAARPDGMDFDIETMPDWFGLPQDADPLPASFLIDWIQMAHGALDPGCA